MNDFTLQPADIVLVHGVDVLSLGIETVSRSPYSHCALVVDPTSVDRTLIEAQGFRDVGYQRLDKYTHHMLILRVPNLTAEQRGDVIRYAIDQIGSPYDYGAILQSAERYLMGTAPHTESPHKFICSTLIQSAYAKAGIYLTTQPLASPDDIYWSPACIPIGRC